MIIIDTLNVANEMTHADFLDGQLLLAMPGMPDERFTPSCRLYLRSLARGGNGFDHQPARVRHRIPLLFWTNSRSITPAAASACRRRPRNSGPEGWARRDRPGFRAAFIRLLYRQVDPSHRRRHLPHRDRRHPARHCQWRRSAQCGAWLSAMPDGVPDNSRPEINENGWLHCDARSRPRVRRPVRDQIRPRPAKDRHRPGDAVV